MDCVKSGKTHMGHRLNWSSETRFEATPVSASQARAFVSRHLVEHRLFYLVDPIRLVASELATNALVHAQTAFTVALSETDETVLLTVRDDSESVPIQRAHRVLDTTGRGLQIVEFISLDWGVSADHSGSKTVWASFAKRPARAF
jgi:anti-sigma regulatory factor (Ser/Thr protein kinase)